MKKILTMLALTLTLTTSFAFAGETINKQALNSFTSEFAGATDLFAKRGRVLSANRNAFDLVAVNHNRRVRQHFAVSRINHRGAHERNLLSVNRSDEGYERDYERNSKFHSRDSSTSLGMTKTILLTRAPLSQQL